MSLSGFSESTINDQNENPSSIASLVYAGGHLNGYRAPTTREIPQLRLPSLETPPPDEEFRAYQQQLGDFTELDPLAAVPALESVPSVFSLPDFSLDNPRVFAQVVGTDEAIDYTILLEKMSWYIDIVELHLLDNISRASSSFFKVTSQFNDIESSARETTGLLTNLCKTVDKIREFGAHEMETLQFYDKLDGLQDLASHLDQLGQFYTAYKECRDLMKENVPLAATKIAATRELLASPHDLTSINVLAPAIADLNSFTTRVANYYNDELNTKLLQDMLNHIGAVPQQDTLLRIGRILHVPGHKHSHNYNNSWSNVSSEFRSELQQLLKSALDNNILDTALVQYKDTMLREIKALVRQSLPQSRDPDSRDGSSALAISLRELSVGDFEEILKKVFAQLSEAFRRISTQSKLLLDLCSTMGHPPPIGDLLETLISSTDSRLSKVLKVRKEVNATYSVNEYMHLYSLCGIFMSECESICSVYPPELSAYLASQTDLYTREFSDRHFKQVIKTMDLDTWKKEEVPPNFQNTVDLVVESGDQDPIIWLQQWRAVIDGTEDKPITAKKLPQNVFVRDSSYFITRSAVKVVQVLSELLELACLLTQTSNDLSHKYIELFDIFDEKTRALILGAGAMTSGSGLKRITFRQLSLAFESLGFLDSVLEYSKGCFQRHLQDSSSFISACETLKAKLRVHRNDIENKFLRIMTDKAQSYARSITITNWAACPPTAANQYMQNLVKDISTVSRILEDTLNKVTAQQIVARIFDIYKSTLLESYTSLRIQNSGALENVMKDIRYFRDHIKDVKGSGNLGEILYETMSAFAIPEETDEPPRPPSPVKPVGDMNTTVGDVSEADISTAPAPSRYRDKALPDVPVNNVLGPLSPKEEGPQDVKEEAQEVKPLKEEKVAETPQKEQIIEEEEATTMVSGSESEPKGLDEKGSKNEVPKKEAPAAQSIDDTETVDKSTPGSVETPEVENTPEIKSLDAAPEPDEVSPSSSPLESQFVKQEGTESSSLQNNGDQEAQNPGLQDTTQKSKELEGSEPKEPVGPVQSEAEKPEPKSETKASNGTAGQAKKKKNKKKGKKK